jgi:uncharacterized membrane protein
MSSSWENAVQRWSEAGLLDAATAEKIRAWEQAHGGATPSRLAALAFGFGGLLLIAGAFLFVSAHWDEMGPAARFVLVLGVTALFHVGGAFSRERLPALATSLHAAGTAAFGAGIFLCGQIFNMAEHWPGALMLWALGAAAALVMLRDWPHVLWVALLVPSWLWGEWIDDVGGMANPWHNAAPVIATVLLALAYLDASAQGRDAAWRRTLSRLGAIVLIPACLLLGATGEWSDSGFHQGPDASATVDLFAWAVALALPFATAWALRIKPAFYLLAPLLWCLLVVRFNWHDNHREIFIYALYAIGAAGLAAWGIKSRHRIHINLGVFGFAITLGAFYFSSPFDKLGRSLGLIGIGMLFLGGGWLLERVRRRLLSHIAGDAK